MVNLCQFQKLVNGYMFESDHCMFYALPFSWWQLWDYIKVLKETKKMERIRVLH